jgi:hypothetical protein
VIRYRRRDAKHWNLIGDRREVGQRRAPVDTDMWTRSRGERQIAAQDRGSLRRHDVRQHHGFSVSVPKHSPTLSRPNVANPVRSLTKHRDEISLAVPVGDHHRDRQDAATGPSHHLECGGTSRSDPGAEHRRRHPIQQSNNGGSMATPICHAQIRFIPPHHAPPDSSIDRHGAAVIRLLGPRMPDCPLPA